MKQACHQLAELARRGFGAGLFAGTSGNLSVCDRAAGTVYITPSGLRYEAMAARDIVAVDLASGAVLSAAQGLRPSSELPMHLAIYRARPDVDAVVHTHSPYATAFAAGGVGIPCALIEMVFFLGGDVPVAPLSLPGTEAVGLGAVAALGDRNACLLENHGVVAIGSGLPEAYLRAEYVEDAARICLLARQNGALKVIDRALIDQMKGR